QFQQNRHAHSIIPRAWCMDLGVEVGTDHDPSRFTPRPATRLYKIPRAFCMVKLPNTTRIGELRVIWQARIDVPSHGSITNRISPIDQAFLVLTGETPQP